jgi:hypothetical protein
MVLVSATWVASLSIPSTAFAQRQELTLVVSALTADGRPADSLTPDDLVIREDGVAREVLRISRVTEPMQLALLVDNSTAMEQDLANLREGLLAFAGALDPRHRISLVSYADRPTLLTSLSSDRAQLRGLLMRLYTPTSSGAYLLEALDETAQGFIKQESPRPVIVVAGTDGVEFSRHSSERILDRLRDSGAQLHVLWLQRSGSIATTPEEQYRDVVIEAGPRGTGGRRDNLLTSLGFSDAMRKLAAELDNQFHVVYIRPDSLIPPRRTEVSSGRPGLVVRGGPTRGKS